MCDTTFLLLPPVHYLQHVIGAIEDAAITAYSSIVQQKEIGRRARASVQQCKLCADGAKLNTATLRT